MKNKLAVNPYKPGAGHKPPYLAGRSGEINEFKKLLEQKTILSNLIVTGLRGVGKTVLIEEFKPYAIVNKWMWVSGDFSESASVTEETFAIRLLTDLSVATAGLIWKQSAVSGMGFAAQNNKINQTLNYGTLLQMYANIPGLAADKIKGILEIVWGAMQGTDYKGIVFVYDEAQNMTDHAEDQQYPLSVLLDVFQSIQKKGVPFLLVLGGLPTLFPKLVEARTYSERMFNIMTLSKLNENNSREAINKPLENCPVTFKEASVNSIVKESGGYPYFIQFMCKEAFDVFVQNDALAVPVKEIIRKLDTEFFAGRWARVTDRQRDLLYVIATLEHADDLFSVQEIVEAARKNGEKFSPSHVSQMLVSLIDAGLVYKDRYGKYSFAVPLLSGFIQRQKRESKEVMKPGLT